MDLHLHDRGTTAFPIRTIVQGEDWGLFSEVQEARSLSGPIANLAESGADEASKKGHPSKDAPPAILLRVAPYPNSFVTASACTSSRGWLRWL
jgi:hypothetical protein